MSDTTISNLEGGPEVPVEVVEKPPDCIMCLTFIDWLDDAWPDDATEPLPVLEPRPAGQTLRIHRAQSDPMPFCDFCARLYMAAMAQFHKERQEREGKEATALNVSVKQEIVKPGIVLPGQAGFKVP